jgi:hypothetical protein
MISPRRKTVSYPIKNIKRSQVLAIYYKGLENDEERTLRIKTLMGKFKR